MSADTLTQGDAAPSVANSTGVAAFFDVDGTLADTTIAHHYLYFRRRRLPPVIRSFWHAWFLLKCLGYLAIDRIDRTRLNRVFYRNYRGLPQSELVDQSADCFREVIRPRIHADGLRCLREHQQQGRSIVLVTGSLDFVIRPLADWIGGVETVCASLECRDGRFTGRLAGTPISHDEKARRIRDIAGKRSWDLSQSFAYGDSIADLAMLECVGRPNAVNPDARLRRIARDRGWPRLMWTRDAVGPGVSSP